MKNILIVNQKGGVGKSTLADLLAWEFEKAEIPYNFYDLDGQGGVVHETFENPKAKVSVIDTPGALQKDMYAWIKEANLIIVPTKATMMDVKPLQRMIELVKDAKCPVLFVEMMWNRFTTASSFEEWLKTEIKEKYQILRIPQSEQFAQAAAIGCSVIDYAPRSSAAEAALAFVNHVRKNNKSIKRDLIKTYISEGMEMAKPKVNASLFGQAATARKEEQQAIEETIRTGDEGKQTGRGRPVKNEEPTITVTVRMTADRKQKLKEYAVMHKRTVSDVLSEFIDNLD